MDTYPDSLLRVTAVNQRLRQVYRQVHWSSSSNSDWTVVINLIVVVLSVARLRNEEERDRILQQGRALLSCPIAAIIV